MKNIKFYAILSLSILFMIAALFLHYENYKKEESIKRQVEIISKFNNGLRDNRINFLGYDGSTINVSLTDNSDEDLKNKILSLPGVDRKLINFIEFEIEWSGFLETEPPKDKYK